MPVPFACAMQWIGNKNSTRLPTKTPLRIELSKAFHRSICKLFTSNLKAIGWRPKWIDWLDHSHNRTNSEQYQLLYPNIEASAAQQAQGTFI